MFSVALRVFGVFAGGTAFATPLDLDREIVLAPQGGSTRGDAEVARWQARAGATSAQAQDFERLGWAYVAKARRTLDAGYYKLAEKTVDVAEKQFGVRPDTRLLRGHVQHNLHHFAAAEDIAVKLVAERGASVDLALLSDVLVEQGKLAEAVRVLERLVQAKPGTEAFSRIAHVRWLKGDLAGAIAAMAMAARATSHAEPEITAWVLTRLSGYRLQAGECSAARELATGALAAMPDFAPALLALGRSESAAGNANEAVDALERAAGLNPMPEYQWWLADALRAAGRDGDALRVEANLTARGAQDDPRTYALYLATRELSWKCHTHGYPAISPYPWSCGAPTALFEAGATRASRLHETSRLERAKAVQLAREELHNRQDVHTHDALAWALAAQGDIDGAEKEIRAALAEGTNDPRLYLHAGLIAQATGAFAAATDYFTRARPGAAALTPSERALLDGAIGSSRQAAIQNFP